MRSLSLLALLALTACTRSEPEGVDADGDGYVDGEDCDDGNPDVNPGAVEVCNGIDDDCSGTVDDHATDGGTFYADQDGDG